MFDVLSLPGWAAEPELHVAKVQIRSAAAIPSRLAKALAMEIPETPDREAGRAGLSCATIAPGEWLLTGTDVDVAGALQRVREAFSEDLCLAIDLTAGRYSSRFSGSAALDFLAAYSPVDFGAAKFVSGTTARTQLGDISVFVSKLDAQPTFRLIIERSMLTYFHNLLGRSRPKG